MSAREEGPESSSGMSRPSSVDPNIYVLLEAIYSSMENSMKLMSATRQKNALVMANTIREGFAARPSIEGTRNTLSKKRACTSLQVALDDSSGVIAQTNLEHAEGGLYCPSGGGFTKPLRRGRSSR